MAIREWTEEELRREYDVLRFSGELTREFMSKITGKSLRQKEIMLEFMLKEAGYDVRKKIGGQRRN